MFTNIKDLATAYGIIIDKELKSLELKIKSKENEETEKKNGVIDELIGALNKAKELKTNPRQIAESVVEVLKEDNTFSDVSIAGPGFINLTLNKDFLSNLDNAPNIVSL